MLTVLTTNYCAAKSLSLSTNISTIKLIYHLAIPTQIYAQIKHVKKALLPMVSLFFIITGSVNPSNV